MNRPVRDPWAKIFVVLMKRLLIVLVCVALFGACTRDDAGEQAGSGREMLLTFANDSSGAVATGRSVAVCDMLTDVAYRNVQWEPMFFEAGEPVVLRDVMAEERVILAVGGVGDGEVEYASFDMWRDSVICLQFPASPYMGGDGALFAGLMRTDGSEETGALEMSRIVGGVEVNVSGNMNWGMDSEWMYTGIATVKLEVQGWKEVWLGDYAVVPYDYWGEIAVSAGGMYYMFPMAGKVRGTIEAEFFNMTTFGYEMRTFRFESALEMEANKVVHLDVTLPERGEASRAGGEAVATVEREWMENM